MHKFINFMNKLTDMDWGWWPFLFLRPEKNEHMTTLLVLKMSLLFGSFYGLLFGIYIFTKTNSFLDIIEVIVFFIIFFFIFYRLTFAIFWNIRAKKLIKKGEK